MLVGKGFGWLRQVARNLSESTANMFFRYGFLLVALLSLMGFSDAKIEVLNIDKDSRTTFHIESFGYEQGGEFKLHIDDFLLMVPHDYKAPESFKIAFVLQKSPNGVMDIEENSATRCFHKDEVTAGEDFIIDLSSRSNWKSLDFTATIKTPGFYQLYFSNCEIGTQAGFKMRLEEYNVVNGEKIYLSAGEASLPVWYFVICAIFIAMVVVWFRTICKDRENTRSIHYLMAVVLVLKVMTLFFESFKYQATKTTGENNGWSILFHIFNFLKGMMMFSVIVLIGTGWSYLKPFLTERDKQIMLVVFVVQVMVNIAMVVVDDESPGSKGWMSWRDVLHLLDMLCCCLILLPIVWSIKHLREAAGADGKAAANMKRLQNFRSFYLLVVSYVYFTRIIVFLLEATLPFEQTWLGQVFYEAAAMVFYSVTGFLFRPQARNPYLALGKDEDEADLDDITLDENLDADDVNLDQL